MPKASAELAPVHTHPIKTAIISTVENLLSVPSIAVNPLSLDNINFENIIYKAYVTNSPAKGLINHERTTLNNFSQLNAVMN